MHLPLPVIPLEPALGSLRRFSSNSFTRLTLFCSHAAWALFMVATYNWRWPARRPWRSDSQGVRPGAIARKSWRGQSPARRGRSQGGREGWLATAPAPEFSRLCDGRARIGSWRGTRPSSIRHSSRSGTARRLFLRHLSVIVSRSRGTEGFNKRGEPARREHLCEVCSVSPPGNGARAVSNSIVCRQRIDIAGRPTLPRLARLAPAA